MTSASWAADGPDFGPRELWNLRRAARHGHRHGPPHADRPHGERHHEHDRGFEHHRGSEDDSGFGHGRRRAHRHGGREAFGPLDGLPAHMSRAGHGGHGGPGDFGFFGGRGFGPGDFPFGPGFWGPHGRRRGPRAGRGDVRAGILALLAEEPRNGYQIIQELQSRSGGAWRVSPGSVYPALSQLEDEGLIEPQHTESKRVFALTDAGRQYVQEHQDETSAPWNAFAAASDDDAGGLHAAIGPTMIAVAQVAQAGTPAQIVEATRLIEELRRSLYRILAEEDTGPADAEPDVDE